jgi:hypothetical protein
MSLRKVSIPSTKHRGRLIARCSHDQKPRRFLLRFAGCCCAGSVRKLPQMGTPAKIAKTKTTAAETGIESTGIATSFEFRGTMLSF